MSVFLQMSFVGVGDILWALRSTLGTHISCEGAIKVKGRQSRSTGFGRQFGSIVAGTGAPFWFDHRRLKSAILVRSSRGKAVRALKAKWIRNYEARWGLPQWLRHAVCQSGNVCYDWREILNMTQSRTLTHPRSIVNKLQTGQVVVLATQYSRTASRRRTFWPSSISFSVRQNENWPLCMAHKPRRFEERFGIPSLRPLPPIFHVL